MKARHKDTGEIIELAEEGIISCDGRRFCWYQVELIPEPIDDFKPSLPSNLDEAAQKVEDYYDVGEEHGYLCCHRGDIKDAFKAGAEWMAGQGASYNTEVGWIDGPTVLDWPDNILDGFKMGDKVVVQIRKK